MKKRVVDKNISFIIVTNFFTLPFIGWLLFEFYGCGIGLILALLIDKFSFKWAYELTWNDIKLAIDNQYLFGVSGSLLCFKYQQRKLFIYRDKKKDQTRMAFRIPLVLWNDVISKSELEEIAHKFDGWYVYDKMKNQECFSYFPLGGTDDCFEILKIIIERSFGGLKPTLAARIDYTKKDIWEGRWKPENRM